MQTLLIAAILVLSTPLINNPNLAADKGSLQKLPEIHKEKTVLAQNISLTTQTQFREEEKVVEEEIPFTTEFKEDPEKELGFQEVTQEGKDGLKTITFKVTYWKEEEIEQTLVDTKIEEAINEIVVKGTKKVIRDLETEELGNIEYKEKLTVWATSYDGNCAGCLGRTATGKRVTHGICATDPEVIPLGTAFYVPGYGMCSAQDTGGAIKGNKIDLGFEDVRNGWWSSRYTDIYIIP